MTESLSGETNEEQQVANQTQEENEEKVEEKSEEQEKEEEQQPEETKEEQKEEKEGEEEKKEDEEEKKDEGQEKEENENMTSADDTQQQQPPQEEPEITPVQPDDKPAQPEPEQEAQKAEEIEDIPLQQTSDDIEEIPQQQTEETPPNDDAAPEEQQQPESPKELPPVSGSSASVRSTRSNSPIEERERFKVTLIEPLEKRYTCPQCNDVLRYPVQFSECGHHVCSSCFHEFLRVEPRCPVDQAPIDKDKCTLDKQLNEEIMGLQVRCNNNEWGCTWEGLHKEALPHHQKCEYTDILCVNDCGAKFQRRFLQKHLDKDCPKKIISCAFCDDRFLREEKKSHLEDCLKVPLPCPNKCDKKLTIARDELDKHIEVDCPRTKIVCQFEEIGCGHRCSREKLSKHYKAGIIEHVRILYDVVMKQGQRLDQHHELLQDHGALLETHQQQITDMERISRNQLIWRIDEFSRKFKEAKAGNTTTLFSPPFNTSKHGYRLCASLCLNGDGKGKGTHISAFISILKGAFDNLLKWPFSYRVTFYLLDQNTDPSLRKHVKFSIKPNPCEENEPFLGQPKMEKNASFGGAKFVKHEEAESRTYIKDDTIFLKIAVDCDGSVEP